MSVERPQIDKPEGDIPFELGIEDLTVGDGDEATKGKEGVRARRWRRPSPPVRSSTPLGDRERAFEFKLGKGQVIPGWDAGVEGMQGRRPPQA